MKDLKLIVLDVDGILTDGKKTYSQDGKVVSKQFCDLDFTAIKIFQSMDINVVLLTGDNWNKILEKTRNIPTYVSRKHDGSSHDKGVLLMQIAKEYDLDLKQIWYAGDDLFDCPALDLAGYASVPSNSPFFVIAKANVEINRESGSYFVSAMLEHYLKSADIALTSAHIDRVALLDQNEASSGMMSK